MRLVVHESVHLAPVKQTIIDNVSVIDIQAQRFMEAAIFPTLSDICGTASLEAYLGSGPFRILGLSECLHEIYNYFTFYLFEG